MTGVQTCALPISTLGNFATKLLSGKPLGITRVHGHEQEVMLGPSRVLLYPLYHPAAALYTPSMLKVLSEDFSRIPALIGLAAASTPVAATAGEEDPIPTAVTELEPVQLGLF